MFQTPILFLIYNRPESTYLVFDSIKKIKPKYLFIAADGPRKDKIGDADLCNKTRLIINEVDWDCEVKTLLREHNLGCGRAVSSAITWFFNYAEQGIILEDDTLPDLSFFPFCEELLEKYKNDTRVCQISGNNFNISTLNDNKYSYIFTKYVSIWGWATWKRAWDNYDFEMDLFDVNNNYIKEILEYEFNSIERQRRIANFNLVKQKKIDTWDHQWMFCNLIQNTMTIIPTSNLVTNIGFGIDATHTTQQESNIANLDIQPMQFPLKHPSFILRTKSYDGILNKNIRTIANTGFLTKIKNKFKQVTQ